MNPIYEKLSNPICGMHHNSIINDKQLLSKIYDSCYFNGDLRASWIGPGLPKTDCNHTMPSVPILPITYWSTWALEHWVMYYGFIHDIGNTSKPVDILDIGCGVGFNTINLAYIFTNSSITAVDLDSQTLDFAIQHNSNSAITYMLKDATLFSDDNKYDYIFCMEILEHVKAENHYGLLDKLLWLLKPGGKLFITTPNFPDSLDANTEHGHIGMLNRQRSLSFFDRYDSHIESIDYFDNTQLKSCDTNRFIIKGNEQDFDKDDGVNRSHYKIVMVK